MPKGILTFLLLLFAYAGVKIELLKEHKFLNDDRNRKYLPEKRARAPQRPEKMFVPLQKPGKYRTV